MNRRINRNQGFTLVEVLLVLGILVSLAAVSITVFSGTEKKSKIKIAKLQINEFVNAIDRYQRDMGKVPEELTALYEKPSDEEEAEDWAGPYIKLKDGKMPKDPWKLDFVYEAEADSDEEGAPQYKISSNGPNKTAGDEDDISNVETEN